MPVLNIFAEQDHLVPPSSSRVLGDHVGTKDYTQLAFKGGHIGIYVSGRAQREVPPAIHDWLRKRGLKVFGQYAGRGIAGDHFSRRQQIGR